jgi:SAM-dependent methyltransferase
MSAAEAFWDDVAPMLATPPHDAAAQVAVAALGQWAGVNGWAGKRVLDACAGLGRYALACAEAGASVTANDLSAERLAALAERAAERGVTVELLCADARALPVEQGFDIVVLGGNLPGLWMSEEEDLRLFAGLAASVVDGGLLMVEFVTREQELACFEPVVFAERRGMVVTERRCWIGYYEGFRVELSAHCDEGFWHHSFERAVRSIGEWESLLARTGWQVVTRHDGFTLNRLEPGSSRTGLLLRRGAL